jgi:glutathione synthase/RimK-type ligase-like ATP-grasp enzyme
VALDFLNLRAAVDGDWRLPLGGSGPATFRFGGRDFEIRPDDSVFCRLIDLSSLQDDRDARRRWRGMVAGLAAWLEQTDGTVVNRPGHAADNGAKPLHEAWLRAMGFDVPPTLTSSSGQRLADFAAGGPTVAKSVAGIRADTRIMTPESFADFDSRSGPVHLQRRIEGRDVRLHVVDDEVHGELIESDAVDYRTTSARFVPFEPPPALAASVVAATRAAGLLFAGWDFKLDGDGRYWCLEANPMPGYDGYDTRADGAISRSLVARLTSRRP